MGNNSSLITAKNTKDDEFYTQLDYIEKEVWCYAEWFKDKNILCNCNDHLHSSFCRFFVDNFEELKLARLVCFSHNKTGRARKIVLSKGKIQPIEYEAMGDGDFRSSEVINELKIADIVVTNPPFSLFREYIAQLLQFNKKFLIIANQNCFTYKDIFPLIKYNRIWTGYNSGDMKFKVPVDSEPRATRYWVDDDGQKWRSLGNVCWLTNLPTTVRDNGVELKYGRADAKEDYLTYDNYDAINVGRVVNIPKDYTGKMGVPITFITKYSPKQFKILDAIAPKINGKALYKRVIIQRNLDF